MKKIYKDNGLPFYDVNDISTRNHLIATLSTWVQGILVEQNRSWVFKQIEAPVLIPRDLVNKEYSDSDFFSVNGDTRFSLFALRPETTAASYAYAEHLNEHQHFVPPLCIWQNAKSFRKENDQVTKNMRFKEFYQLEFQCIYTEGTNNDYQSAVLEPLRGVVSRLTGKDARIVESDRLPSYSSRTMDIEVDMGYKWLEVCSISLRNDVPFEWNGKKLLNCEIAFGTDRLTKILSGDFY